LSKSEQSPSYQRLKQNIFCFELKELAPGKALARIATQFTEEEDVLQGEWYHGGSRFQLGRQLVFTFSSAGTHGVLREIFRNLKNIGLGVLLTCNTIYGVHIVPLVLLAVVFSRNVDCR
jgi:hypothetical protein